MARPKPGNPVSLFPFLAVLVCAMGSLILLLLVMTRKIRDDRNQQSPTVTVQVQSVQTPDFQPAIDLLTSEIAEVAGELQGMREDERRLRTQIAVLRQQRDNRKLQLSQLQDQLDLVPPVDTSLAAFEDSSTSLEDREQQLLLQLTKLEAELLQKQENLRSVETEVAAAEILLQERRSALLSLREQAAENAAATAIASEPGMQLDFTGSTGTSRTPVVVNVTEDGFEFLPGGPTIGLEEMKSFPVRDNPLLSAVLAIDRIRSGDSLTSEPYVLLLVRPGGSLPFYAAQRTLGESEIHFGYELLEPEQVVELGSPSAEEQLAAKQAVQECLLRRERLYSKLFALAEKNKGSPSSDEAGEPVRRMEIRPDGRVVESWGGRSGATEGRYYAGGVAPPPSFFKNRARNSIAAGALAGPRSAAEANRLAEEFAARFEAQRRQRAEQAQNVGNTESPAFPQSPDTAPSAATANANLQDFDDWLNGPAGAAEDPGRPADFSPLANSGHSQDQINLPERQSSAPPLLPTSRDATTAEATSSAATAQSWLNSLSHSTPGTIPPLAGTSASQLDQETRRLLGSQQQGRPRTAIPVGIVVFLDPQHLTVGQQQTVPLQYRSAGYAATKLLRAIHLEVAAAAGTERDPVMPIVKFIVSPGGDLWRIQLRKSLREAGIRSVTTYRLSPWVQPANSAGYARVAEQSAEVIQ